MKTDTHLTEAFGRLIAKDLSDWYVPGLEIAVVRTDKTDTKVGACVLISLSNTADRILYAIRATDLPSMQT